MREYIVVLHSNQDEEQRTILVLATSRTTARENALVQALVRERGFSILNVAEARTKV